MKGKLGALVKMWSVVAVAVLASAGGVVTAPSPAAAAVPAVWIFDRSGNYCLDQHFNAAGATTLVRAWPQQPCHTVGNQLWRFEYVRDPNQYRVVNNRWDSRGPWCLSAPNGNNSDVYAELCVTPLPLKQTWTPGLRSSGYNQLRNELSYHCLQQDNIALTRVYVRACDWRNNWQDWFWLGPARLNRS